MRGAERLRRLPRRAAATAHRLAFPEAASAAEHWQRVILDRAVDEFIAWLDPPRCSAAEISGDAHAGRPWREYAGLIYPEFDVCAPLTEERRFDVVICEQVLEHVDDPCAAASNLRELCVPGGHVIVSTPFLIRVHELPIFLMRDYWRFTPRGLQILLERAELEIVAAGAWGNRECVIGNFSRWSAYRRWHPLRNEPEYPVQVWAFARRSADRADVE
jgi:SAM-dependent methyltransferase